MEPDDFKWVCKTIVEKYRDGEAEPYERREVDGNVLSYGGASALWDCLINASPTAPNFASATAAIGVGDSTTAAAASQTGLQASSNKTYKAATISHTDGTSSSAATSSWTATFGASDANYAWEEWGIFDNTTPTRMLNRKVESLGTKVNGESWTVTIQLTLS